MNKDKVLQLLKTKASAFGFNQSELASVTDTICDNLQLTEETTEEAVTASIDAILPILKVGQQHATRMVRGATPEVIPPAPNTGDNPSPSSGSNPNPNPQATDEAPSWFKSFADSLESRISKIEGEKVQNSRRAKAEEVLGQAGVMGKRLMATMERIAFRDEADFDQWLAEAKADVEAYRQEEGNDALSRNAQPNKTQPNATTKATDAEISELVKVL